MDINNVPQDDCSTYANNKRAIYATDVDGKVKVVSSSGWEAEEIATVQALQELKNSACEAYREVKRGEKSTLYYYMFALRMDLKLLAESTGFYMWTIKRDFNPDTFAKIKDKRLKIYADALGKTKEELNILEDYNDACE